MKKRACWWTLFVSALILISEIEACKKSVPPPTPRCKQPKVPASVAETGGWLACSGYGDRYLNVPKDMKEASMALLTEGGVIENGTLVIKKELIVPKEEPETSECHFVCMPGYLPVPSTTSCKDGVWTNDPSAMACLPSSCGVPPNPDHGKYYCYGNPSSCYLTCDPGYVTGSSNPVLSCQDGAWSSDSQQAPRCEVAVALLTGGIGPDTDEDGNPLPLFPNKCQTAEVFSSTDDECSSAILPLLKIGIYDHTSHLINGEILICGGNECGEVEAKLFSGIPVYNDTNTQQSCFSMLADNSWTLHSEFVSSWKWNHMSAVQQNSLQLIGGVRQTLKPALVLNDDAWLEGRTPSLPPTIHASGMSRPCLVVTSPITYIVIGGSSYDLLTKQQSSSVLEFNSLTQEWRSLPDIPVGRGDHACALVTTKSGPGVMVAGGTNYRIDTDNVKHSLNSVFLLDLSTETWYPAGILNDGRTSFGLAVFGKRVMVLGRMSRFTYPHDGKQLTGKESVEEYVVPCQSLKECEPSQEGVWKLTDRVLKREYAFSLVPVPASRFNCTG